MKYHGLVGRSPDVMRSSGNLRLATTDVRVPEKKYIHVSIKFHITLFAGVNCH